MGYRRRPKLYRMTFEDHPGLEVTMRGLSVDAFRRIMGLTVQLKDFDPAQPDPAKMEAGLAAMGELFDRFAAGLDGWNLEDEDGKPVPATARGVGGQDLEFVLELVMEWMGAAASVDSPLPGSSRSTPPSGLGLSALTEPSSASPGS